MSLNSSAKFWLLNLLAWTLYYVITGTTSPLFLSSSIEMRMILITFFIFLVLAITGFYRVIYKYFRFQDKSLRFIAVQMLVASVAMIVVDYGMRQNFAPYIFTIMDFLGLSYFDNDNPYYQIYMQAETNPKLLKTLDAFALTGQFMKYLTFAVWVSAYNAYKYSDNLVEARLSKYRTEAKLREAELAHLRSQLNPHFLFNALNSIHSLTLTGKSSASDAVLLLSDLMRYTLNYEKKDLVTLEEEIETVEKYLELEKIRFGERLHFSIDAAPETLKALIPPIVVQTLVENAVKHGISQVTAAGFIKIETLLRGRELVINITNSGRMLPVDVQKARKSSGIGVDNTRRRLQMLFGDAACLEVDNADENSVLACVKLPFTEG